MGIRVHALGWYVCVHWNDAGCNMTISAAGHARRAKWLLAAVRTMLNVIMYGTNCMRVCIRYSWREGPNGLTITLPDGSPDGH